MKRFAWIAVFAALVTGAAVWAQVATNDTAISSVPQAAGVGGDAAEVRTRAIAQLLTGDFQAGSQMLEQAIALSPHDAMSLEARDLVAIHLARRAEDEQQRQVEFDAAVAKAQSLYAIHTSADPTSETFRAARKAASDARQAIGELVGTPGAPVVLPAADFPAQVDEQVAAAREWFDDILGGFAAEEGRHVDEIEAAVRGARQALDAFQAAVAEQAWETEVQRQQGMAALREQADNARDAVDTVTLVLTEYPLRAALEQVRLAKEISPDPEAFLREPWIAQIESDARTVAQTLQEARDWYRALSFYSALADLHPQSTEYREAVRQVSRHARVISLYAPAEVRRQMAGLESTESEDGEPLEAVEEPADDTERWREYVDRVDAKMVKQAIAHLEEGYVDTVDYRKVILGAINAVRTLAEAPELAGTFPGLADEDARRRFLQSLDVQEEITNHRDTVRHFHVSMTLDRLLAANQETVQLPAEVLDVEFTDGMLEQLDQFSSMIWPSEWDDFNKQTTGSFFGVGIQIQMENGAIKVVSPLEDTPAYRAGILAGDLIIAIDGESTRDMDVDDAVKRITGPRGTKVVLTIRRPGQEEPLDMEVMRDEIHIQTVKGWRRSNGDGWEWMIDPENRIGYIRLTSFTRDTAAELARALQDLREQNVRGLILDLRFNPGGFLRAATQVADEFLSEGTIVSTRGRQQPESEDDANRGGAYLDAPLVVLVNELSASAAEIVGGALKDWDRAIIVGTRSYGKGSVQNLIPIRPEMVYLKLTTAYYYLPNGRCLHRTPESQTWGVEPDVTVAITPEQLRRWLELRRQTEIIQERTPEQLDEEMTAQLRADIQLDTALTLLRLDLLDDAGGPTEVGWTGEGSQAASQH